MSQSPGLGTITRSAAMSSDMTTTDLLIPEACRAKMAAGRKIRSFST
jgi:hypothetical protein